MSDIKEEVEKTFVGEETEITFGGQTEFEVDMLNLPFGRREDGTPLDTNSGVRIMNSWDSDWSAPPANGED